MPSPSIQRLFAIVLFALLAVLCAPALPAQSTSTWNGGSGNWSNPNNWTPSGLPGPGTDVFVNVSDPISANIFFDSLQQQILNLQVSAGNTLHILNGNSLEVAGDSFFSGNLTNDGYFSSWNLFLSPGSVVTNTGVILGHVSVGGVLNNSGHLAANDYFYSLGVYGTVNNLSGGVFVGEDHANFYVASSGTFNNAGLMELRTYNPFSIAGTWANTSTGQVYLTNSTTIDITGSFSNSGYVSLNEYSQLIFHNPFLNNGTVDLGGAELVLNNTTINGNGTINLLGGNALLYCCNPAILGSFINNGNLIQGAGVIGATDIRFVSPDPNAYFITRGTLFANATDPLVIFTGWLRNEGLVRVASGSTLLYMSPGDYVQAAGTTQVDGVFESTVAAMNIAGGTLTGNGTIMSDVFMNGTLNPGAIGSPGTLTITGNYQQLGGGALTIEMNSMFAGTGHDQLVVGQQATLDGVLNIILASGFLPQLGDTFVILLCGSCTGNFQHINNANFAPGLMFVAIYNANDVTLLVSQTPEPATLALLGTGLCAILMRRRRRAK